MRRRQHRDAHVDRVGAAADGDAAVLRGTTFCNVELAHDLQAAGDGCLTRARDRRQVADDAVDAHANVESALLRREVDVRRSEIERAADGLVDEDDRGCLVVEVENLRLGGVNFAVIDLGDLLNMLVDPRDRALDRIARSDPDRDRNAEGKTKIVREHDVRRVRDRDEDRAVVEEAHGDGVIPASEVLGQQTRRVRFDDSFLELDVLELVLLCEDPADLRAGRRALLDEDLAEPPLRIRALLLERSFELLGGDQTVSDEKRAERGPRGTGRFHVCVIGTAPP